MSDINQSESQIEEEINNSNMDVDWDPIVEQSIHPDLDLDDDIPDLEPAYDINLDIVPPNQNQNPYLDIINDELNRIDDLNNDMDRIDLNNDNLHRIYNQTPNRNFINDFGSIPNQTNDNNLLWGIRYDNNEYYVHPLLPQ